MTPVIGPHTEKGRPPALAGIDEPGMPGRGDRKGAIGGQIALGQDRIARERHVRPGHRVGTEHRSEEHTSELQSLMRTSYAVFCLKTKKRISTPTTMTKGEP